MNRRTFLERAGLGVAGVEMWRRRPAVGSRVGADTTRLGRIGLELYSVRDAMARDPERTLAAVRAMGYEDVELLWSFGNFGRSTTQVRRALANEGLRASSAHISPAAVLVGWERALATAAELGHEYLIVPGFTADTSRTLDDWKEWAHRFSLAGAVARRSGIWLAFHNEPGHMRPIDGVVPYDVFIANADPATVRLQLDVGNMLMGKGDPHAYLARYRDRYWSFHLKDVVADGSRDTELGQGAFDFRTFLAAVPDLGRKPCFVEQEGARDSMASAKLNYRYLAALDF